MRLSFLKVVMAVATAFSMAQATPVAKSTDELHAAERGEVNLVGKKVSVVSGVVLTNGLVDCFGQNGMNVAKAWAEDLYSRWFYANHPGTIVNIDTFASTVELNTQYCITVDAVFTFSSFYDAQAFASFAVLFVTGSLKRDEAQANPDFPMGVFINGVDLPMDHVYFGNATAIDWTPKDDSGTLAKRQKLQNCQNYCPGVELTTRMTNICNDWSFPTGNKVTC
ncbi:hypothetical protein NQ176_g7094 [Zarea fungicola]|uniref:Uncharacterized protein n=1 Tax=Zarea fungicola TaxID=93591 RepID=A0ACC1N266_9HYPO|nr:hypothetical protein NQ176_g7094 [Lecanicillium fungicola]